MEASEDNKLYNWNKKKLSFLQGRKHFGEILLFLQPFQKVSSLKTLKTWDCVMTQRLLRLKVYL